MAIKLYRTATILNYCFSMTGVAIALFVFGCAHEMPLRIEERTFTVDFVEHCKARADSGDAEGQALYGVALLNGWGVEENNEAAVEWLDKASKVGNAIGQTYLGGCFYSGNVSELVQVDVVVNRSCYLGGSWDWDDSLISVYTVSFGDFDSRDCESGLRLARVTVEQAEVERKAATEREEEERKANEEASIDPVAKLASDMVEIPGRAFKMCKYFVCRAGSTNDYCKLEDGTEITDETLGDVAWYDENSNDHPHPVGLKKPNAFGLYDMLGNVAEWTCDLSGADMDYRTLIKGGSALHVFSRDNRDCGFRLARSLR